MSRKLDPYTRIMRAAEVGRGVVLSAEEVQHLSRDDAIATTALNIAMGDDISTGTHTLSRAGYRPVIGEEQ